MLKREIRVTQDGSKTLYIPDWNESYHSKHGALQEAKHVFVQHGLAHFSELSELSVLEFGLGTGLNCLLSYLYAEQHKIKITYTSLEKYPIASDEIQHMGFDKVLAEDLGIENYKVIAEKYQQIHSASWENMISLDSYFHLKKLKQDFRDFMDAPETYEIVFYDAFGMRVQPELWDQGIFENIFTSLKKNGLLTTYAANGKTKRALQACGFEVEKLKGPPGKREMINAWKRQ